MSADMLDAADRIEQVYKDARIQSIRSQGRELYPKGECHWCETPFEEGSQQLFCAGGDCTHDWERYKQSNRGR